MDKPNIAARTPMGIKVQAGKTYFWCACGLSAKQPFCDGSHQDTGFTPLKYTADRSGLVFFCRCKHTARPPLCDGTHSNLD